LAETEGPEELIQERIIRKNLLANIPINLDKASHIEDLKRSPTKKQVLTQKGWN